jgi:general secretion pathway protein L
MPQTLLLRLPAVRSEDTEWLTIDEAGEPATARQRGPLSLAAAVGRSAKVVVLAPATQILLAEPELPPGSGVKLARAVPFALEEQLTEDIDQLVFALGKRRPAGGTPVAVVSRSVRLAVRRPGMLPFAVELTPVTEALIVAGVIADPLAGNALAAELEPRPLENVILYATREDWSQVQSEIEGLMDHFAALKIQLLPDGPLPWLARDLAATDAVNLLQGDYAKNTGYGVRFERWRTAAALAACLLVIHVAAQAYTLHRAKRDTALLDTEIADVFAAVMPAEPLRDARRQMQSRLDRIRHAGPGPQHFLRTLQTLSGAIAEAPATTIDALSYRDESLDMKVTAPSLAALSQLSQSVGKQGLTAEIQSSTPMGSGVEAHMQVRAQGSKAHP